ncbi:ribosomal protein L1-like protein [Dendryphion nanum]|uniref:Ribosomal protein L1-like protein n=1 Tax=Dendryphion nanum TaxID=256645 RepID=A0A9P9IWU2_9PLEO|nr:ribosomal protein L1-like protein [Dendryphion nanum]
MANARPFIAPLSRFGASSIALPRPEVPRLTRLPFQAVRCAATKTSASKKKKKARSNFIQYDLKHAEQFSLVDAMHYIRAFEVGRNPTSVKYEVAVRLRTLKNGPVIRNRLRLPNPVKTDIRICVIAPPDSKVATEARASGASLVGEDEIFDQVKEGIVEFDRLLCHVDSLPKLNKAGLGRILGPKGLMPSVKLGTVVTGSIGPLLKNMVGASEYRERSAVIRLAIGQLAFTPEQLSANVKAFMELLKKDIAQMSERIGKDIHEVVLSSTNAPGFTLNGEFRSANSIPTKELTG